MKAFSESLKTEMERQLKIIHSETDEPIRYAELAIRKLVGILERLKTEFLSYQFEGKSEEIDFFRNIKPQFASWLIYYNDIYNIETAKPFGAKKTIRRYYNAELVKLQVFFNENREFYRYFRTGNRSLDSKYFRRGRQDIRHTLDSFYLQADQRFSTSHDYRVARIIANDKMKIYLETEISRLAQKLESKALVVGAKTQIWTGSKVALVELVYALHAEGVFNDGTSGLKEVISFFESAFGVDLGQFNRTFLEIRTRKSERTKFLNALREKLILRMDDADEN